MFCYYTSASEIPREPANPQKKKPHFISVIATAFGNLQVCDCTSEILSRMHIWMEHYLASALIGHVRKHPPPLYLDTFVKEE